MTAVLHTIAKCVERGRSKMVALKCWCLTCLLQDNIWPINGQVHIRTDKGDEGQPPDQL